MAIYAQRARGRSFGYRRTFDVEWLDAAAGTVPEHIRPLRRERRE